MNYPGLVRYITLLTLLMSITSCKSRRPDYCTAGDQWACDLLDALSHPKPVEDINPDRQYQK